MNAYLLDPPAVLTYSVCADCKTGFEHWSDDDRCPRCGSTALADEDDVFGDDRDPGAHPGNDYE